MFPPKVRVAAPPDCVRIVTALWSTIETESRTIRLPAASVMLSVVRVIDQESWMLSERMSPLALVKVTVLSVAVSTSLPELWNAGESFSSLSSTISPWIV